MSGNGLATFFGTIVSTRDSANPLLAFQSALDEEFNNKDRDRFCELTAEGKPFPFTGLFVHALMDDEVVADESGGFSTLRRQYIDVFGLVYNFPIVVRIDNWRPNFCVLVPAGYKPSAFAAAITNSTYGAAKQTILFFKTRIVEMPEFAMFGCGINRTFVLVEVDSYLTGQCAAKSAVSMFKECWQKVELYNNKYDVETFELQGCIGLNTNWEREMHSMERIHWPLRYTGAMSESEMPYHFMTQENVSFVYHLTISDYTLFHPEMFGIRYTHGVRVDYKSSSTLVGAERPASIVARAPHTLEEDFFRNMLVGSYDIETAKKRTSGHAISDPRVPDDYIMTISLVIYRVSKNIPEVSIAIVAKPHISLPEPGVVIVECEDEADVIHTFASFFRYFHISVMTGFNIDAFDTRYIYLRGMMYHLEHELVDAFSEYDDKRGRVVFKDNEKFKMDGGDVENLHRFVSTQRTSIDAFLRLKQMRPKEFQEGAGLNKMLAWYNVKDPESSGDARKLDLPISEMYDLWEQNTPEGVRTVLRYCVKDSKMTYLLLYWISYFSEMFELSNTSYTTLPDSFHRANSRRVIQRLERDTRVEHVAFCSEVPERGYRVPSVPGRLEGGDVRSLSPGRQFFIISLDYKSEYPAQKEAFNIASSSKVLPAMIEKPSQFGLNIVHRETFVDQYCTGTGDDGSRERYWIVRDADMHRFDGITDTFQRDEMLRRGIGERWVFEVQQFWAEAKDDDGERIRWATYFVQSPRDARGAITHHYSVQAKMLTDLRFERDRMKSRLGEAKAGAAAAKKLPLTEESIIRISKLEADAVTYNMRQNVVKLLMNTEYGTNNTDTAPNRDQDVAATVTWCSRRLAGFLRRILTCSWILLPDYVVTDALRRLIEVGYNKDGCLSKVGFAIAPYEGPITTYGESICPARDAWKDTDGSVIIDPFMIVERRPVKAWYVLTTAPCLLTYQDTDSNYYRNPMICEYYASVPDMVQRVKLTWHALLDHNDMMALLVEGLVNRWPIAVSCDGGGTVGYWSPQKKQYMVLKGPERHFDVEGITESYLLPNLQDRRETEAVSQFLERKKIKVAGFQIIRRETPDYVIEFLLIYLEQLLSMREDVHALSLARSIMARCEAMIKEASAATVHKFSKQQKYRPCVANEVKRIVNRLRTEGKHELIPDEFSVARYVLLSNKITGTDEFRARGRVESGNKTDRMSLVGEFAEGSVNLDLPYYLEKMARALAKLVFEELIEEELRKEHHDTKLGAIFDSYKDGQGTETKESRVEAKRATNEAALLLMRDYYTVQGLCKRHSSQYKMATRFLSKITIPVSSTQIAIKRSLDVSYDRTTGVGELAERIINSEIRAAKMRRKVIADRILDYVGFLSSMNEETRKKYIGDREAVVGADVVRTHHTMVSAYGEMISALQQVDPKMSRVILDCRRNGVDITVNDIVQAIPVDDRFKIDAALITLQGAVEPFRKAYVEQFAFREAWKRLLNTK